MLIAISNDLDSYQADTLVNWNQDVVIHKQNHPLTLIGAVYCPTDHKISYLKTLLNNFHAIVKALNQSML